MLAPQDRLVLASGVRHTGGTLTDDVRGSTWPVNLTGAFVLDRRGRALGEIAAEVARAFALPADRACSDVLAFAWELNRLTLANIERRHGRCRHAVAWIVLALRLLPAGALPAATAARRRLDTRSPLRAAWSVVQAAWARSLVIASLAAVGVLQVGIIAGTIVLAPAVAVGLATGAGVAVHEAAHAAALRGIPSALVLQGRRTYVLHATMGLRRRMLVALAGPCTACLLGLVVMTVSLAVVSPALALAGCPLCAHAAGLTLLGSDGRSACGL